MSDGISVTVTILDKEYRVSCTQEEKAELLASAQYLDEKMRTLRDSSGVVGADRLAVIAALNITHEMLQAKNNSTHLNDNIAARLQRLGSKIENTLGRGGELDL